MIELSFSWDDGHPFDLKLLDAHEQFQIPCMFFIPTKNREGLPVVSPADIKTLSSSSISETGAHTKNHVYLTELPFNNILEEVNDNKKYLENITLKSVQHFCFPGGKYTPQIISELKPLFVSLRTADTMCSNCTGFIRKPTFHFFLRGKKSLLINSMRQHDKLFFSIVKYGTAVGYFDLIKKILLDISKKKELFKIHIWGHSWEIDAHDLWNELYSFFVFLQETGLIQYCKKYSEIV